MLNERWCEVKNKKWTHEYKIEYMRRYNAINRDYQREYSLKRYEEIKKDEERYNELKKARNEWTKKYNKEHREERTKYMSYYYSTPEGKAKVIAAKKRYYEKQKAKKNELKGV